MGAGSGGGAGGRAVREIENVWIPLSDGVRLAARVWIPGTADDDPVPAILEAIPYRKRDLTRGRDRPMHRFFASHGYAAVRLDIRGSGDSDGILEDEYSPRELEDLVEVIGWLARQPWCSGRVGMMGISWGGFNSLQVAALRPPALAAVLTLCSTDDRYADDAHYMGGCLLNENLTWGSVLTLFNALPPDPELAGAAWRTRWLERLEHARLFPAVWLDHPHRDRYWRHGSVCEDYAAIECPVYAIGGWADGYSNAVPRLLAGLGAAGVPRKGLIGPWSHAFPHDSVPGPSIGFLQEALRWWDHWLKGHDTGVMDEPVLRVWMQEYVTPAPTHPERPGRWVAEEEWPSPRIGTARYRLRRGSLEPDPGLQAGDAAAAPPDAARPSAHDPPPESIRSPVTCGVTGGDWCAFGSEGDQPADQREDDGKSLLFDSAPLAERTEILGGPVVELELAADRPVAQVAVRLNDVAPDGHSLRVSYGLLNLTHRDGHETPEALEPDRRYTVRVRLNDVAHAFPAGHRIRIAVSSAYWPIAWPAPEPARLTLFPAGCRLDLPVRPERPDDDALPAFEPPATAEGAEYRALSPVRYHRRIERDLATNETVYSVFSDGGDYPGAALTRLDAIDLEVGYTIRKEFRAGRRDPLSAVSGIHQTAVLQRSGWAIRVQLETRMTATQDGFRVEARLRADENGARVFERAWDERRPRRLV